ncbi:MAG: Gldg family protein [Planctomycetota bacterium]
MALRKADPEAPSFDRRVQSKIAANVVLVSILAVLVVVFANYGFMLWGKKHDLRYDLTASGRRELDSSTKQLARQINHPVDLYLVTGIDQVLREASRANLQANTPDGGILRDIYLPLLQRFTADIGALAQELSAVNDKIRFHNCEVQRDPELANKWRRKLGLGPDQLLNHLVIRNSANGEQKSFSLYRIFDVDLGGPDPTVGHRRPVIRGDFIETSLRFGLKRVLDATERKVYFSVGHGEEELLMARQFMSGDGFVFSPLDFDQIENVPTDADLVIVASPSRSFAEAGRKILEDYLETGGRILLLQGRNNREDFRGLLEKFGLALSSVQVGHPIWNVRGTSPYKLSGFGFLEPARTQPAHLVTASSVVERIPIYLGFSRAYVENKDYDEQKFQRTRLLSSGIDAELMPFVFDGKNWRQAPENGVTTGNRGLGYALTLGTSVAAAKESEATAEKGRAVLMASDEWLSGKQLMGGYSLANADVLTNAVYWLTDKEKLITGTPRRFRGRFVTMEPEDHTTFRILGAGLVPGFILLLGILVFYMRRRT